MRGLGLKSDLTLTIAFLLTTGMLLTDFVIMGLWQYHANQAYLERLTHELALTVASIQDAPSSLTPGDQIRTELEQQGLCLHFTSAVKVANLPRYSCAQNENVATVVETALRDQKRVVRQVDRQGRSEWFGGKWLVVAQPLYQGKELVGAIGLAGPMTTISDLALVSQQHILVYILINAIMLTVVGFFRMSRQVIRPLERLISLADDYQAQDVVFFASQCQTNEISQLSASLNRVVQRIEHDKSVLRQNVEELANTNKQLQENQQEMIRAEKLVSVGRLAAGLAHEIGNPLGVAQGYLQLLGIDGCGKEESNEYVARAIKELERVDSLIRQLLDYARTSKGEPEQFDVQKLLAELVETLWGQPFLDGIRIDLALLVKNAIVFADREQLRQVILNCLLNAADAIKACKAKGEGAISMATSLAAPSMPGTSSFMLQITIQDNGEGVRPELLDTVFDPFFTTKEPGAGTGLGLSVSLALIESMGGKMRLQSIVGEGATVQLLLPLMPEFTAGTGVSSQCNNDGHVDASGGHK